jgi:hypothetical protein
MRVESSEEALGTMVPPGAVRLTGHGSDAGHRWMR